MIKRYKQLKKLLEQKEIQRQLNYLLVGSLILLVAIYSFGFRTQLGLLAGLAERKVLGIHSVPSPIPTVTSEPTSIPTDIPTDTPIPQQTYQQTASQVPQQINCNVTAYVPNYQPIYKPFTPQQCIYEQQYAVSLWNRTVGAQQNTQIPMPQPVYNYPQYNSTVSQPRAIDGQPVLHQPAAPNGSLNFPTPVTPTKTCTTYMGTGASEPVTICE